MIFALDTNVLVRYIVQDEPVQAQKATELIETIEADNPAFISAVVMCELNWVLKSAYRIPKNERIETIEKILSVAVFAIEAHECCMKAVRSYRSGKADFSDYLIRELARAAGYEKLATFDKTAGDEAGFMAL